MSKQKHPRTAVYPALHWFYGYWLVALLSLVLSSPLWADNAAHQEEAQPDMEVYRLGPEDKLQISVWKEEELNREVVVRPDGGISFPLAGELQVAGKTVDRVKQDITQRLKKYIPAAVVSVSVTEVAGYKIYVLGKVNNPGQYVVGRYIDVVQALTLADGLTPFASENHIKIIRRENGREKIYRFSYSDIRKGRNLRQNIMLKSGDVVMVP